MNEILRRKNMNKFFKRLALLLAVLMIVSMMPVQLFADNSVTGEEQSNGTGEASGNSNAVAKIGNTGYESLADAIANATPDTNGVITYKISGKAEISGADQWISFVKNAEGVTAVKFVGMTADAEISITSSGSILGVKGVDVDVSFENLTLSHPNGIWVNDLGHATNYFACMVRNSGHTVTYTNCTFPNGACNNQYGKTVFDGCKFTNATSGKYNFWNYGGNTEIKNSTFTGVRGIKTYNEGTLAVAPTVKIENTTFEGLTEKAAIVASKATDITLDNVSATGCTKGFFQKDIEYSGEKTTIEANGSAISGNFNITAEKGAAAAKEEFNITGGTFKGEVSSDYLADGFEVKDNGDGTYGVAAKNYVAAIGDAYYSTLQEAIDAATRNSIVTLLADTKENVIISTPYVTLDLNGHTLNGSTGERKPALTVTARVTVKDSSTAQTGTIMREDTAENSGVSSHYVIDIQGNGWLTFESGIVKNNSGTAAGKGASLVRVGDDSVAKFPGLNIKGGTFTQDNFIVIKVDRGDLFLNGGTLNSTDSYAVENWLRATIKGGTVNGAVSSWTYSSGSNSTLTISGGTINGNVESVSYDGSVGKKAKVSITGGTVNGTLSTIRYGSTTTPSKDVATIEVTGGTFKEDPTKYVIEDSAINKNDDGTFGVAKAYLAKVGDTSYYTMEEAFKAQTASGEPIVLLRDYTTGSPFNSGTVARVVDLNGHTWTCTGTDANSAAFEINNPNASLTVKNGKIVSSQLVGLIPSAMGGTIKYDNSSLTFENVQMSTTATSGIETNGNNTNDTVKLVNSTLNVPNGFGIYFPSSGELIIENSKITAKTMGVQVCSGALSISGANTAIIVTGDAVEKTENDGAIQDGAAISIVNRTGYKGLDTVTVSGGKFTAKEGNSAIKAYNWANNTESDFTADKGTVAVSGGTFSSEVSEDLCAEGFIPTKNADGTYDVKAGKYVAQIGSTKYETLEEAVAAANAGDTVTLLDDVTADVAINKNITLDLGGKTLTNTNSGKATISVTGGTVTVKNGTVIGGTSYYNIEVTKGSNANLTLEDVTATAGNTGSSMIDNWSTMTIKSGTYTGGMNTVKSEEGSTLVINDGTFTCDYGKKWSYTATILVYGNTTINGGTFIQKTTNTSSYAKVVMTGIEEGYEAITKVTGGTFTNEKLSGIFWALGKATSDNFEVSGGTFNKSVSESYCADGFIPTKNADGTYGVKEGKYVAQIGSTKYETLADAIRLAAKGKTITLLADVTEDVVITANKSITLDLNGKTLNGGTGNTKATITNYGTITITDSSAEKTGTIKRDDNGTEGETSYYVIRNLGTMTIEQANIINNSGYKKTNPSGSMVGSSLICNGDDDAYSAVLNIKGGTIRQDNFIAIKNGSSATLNVTGGKITSKHSAVQNWCNANITGGELNGQLWTDSWDSNSTGNTVMGGDAKFTGEIVVDITGSIVPKFEITGGTLDVTNWRITTAAANAGAKPAVSGGTFKHAVPEEYCADGFIPTKNADDTYGVKEGKYVAQIGNVKYETLEEAYAAAKNGDTITLLEDCKSDRINLEDKSVTVVLNGKTLTSTAAYGVMFCAKNGNKITIDGTVEGSKLVGTLMITAETDGHIEVNGGTYENSQYCPIYVNGAVSSENSTVTVKNAIINATNSNSNQDMGCGVYLAGYSTSVFENCTITAPITGIEIRAGKLTLNNCVVTGGNGEVKTKANGNGTTVTNAALAISQHTTKKPIEVIINGGTFNGTAAVYQTDVQDTGSVDVKIAVNDGTFNGTISGETDGAIVISGGKFKFKVDDKYFADKLACSATPNADGYYTVKDHPITGLGLSIGESLTLRITVDESYKNGKLKYTYIGAKDGKVHSGIVYRAEKDKKGNWVFRISDINAQRADVIYTVQYVDESEKEVGSAKEVSILKYCEGLVEQYKNADEAVKNSVNTLVCKLLNYSAAAMDYRQETDGGDRYNNMTWGERATALRKRTVELCGTVTDYAFEVSHEIRDYGTDKNAVGVNGEKKVGIEFSDKIRLFFNINYNENYTYTYNGLKCIPEEVSGASTTHRIYVTVAPFAYDSEHCIEISDADGFVYEIAYSLDNALESLAEKYSGTAAGNLAKATYEYCRALTDFAKYFK